MTETLKSSYPGIEVISEMKDKKYLKTSVDYFFNYLKNKIPKTEETQSTLDEMSSNLKILIDSQEEST